ncbi:hypothetical protein K8T06_08005 [bacterium]|nr:hypothetical protein [bacterium]
MRKLLTVALLGVIFFTGLTLADFNVGDYSCGPYDFRFPVNTYFENSRSIYCIDSGEISVGEDQTLTCIGWFWCLGDSGIRTIDVYIKETSDPCPDFSVNPGDLTAAGFTQVVDNQVLDIQTSQGWNSVDFNVTNFDFHVGNNLLIAVCSYDDFYFDDYTQWAATAGAYTWFDFQDASPGARPCLDFSQQYSSSGAINWWPATSFCSHPLGGPTATPTATPTPGYCPGTGGGDEYISGVEMGSISNTGTASDGYSDYTAMSTTLIIGTGDTITVTPANSELSDICTIWVDWNQDLDWDDPGEQIFQDTGWGPYSGTVIPPMSASIGPTRMRVRLEFFTFTGPCGATTYGEVEDYTVNVQPPSEVYLNPDDSSEGAILGITAVHNFSIRNFTGSDDTFDLSVTGNSWTTRIMVGGIEQTTIFIAADAMESFTIEIDVPGSTTPWDTDSCILEVWDSGHSFSDTSTVNTTAYPFPYAYGIDLNNDKLIYWGDLNDPGTVVMIGSTGGEESYYAGDFLGNDFSQLYLIDNSNDTFMTMSTADASETIIGACAPVGGSWTGMTSTDDGSVLYASSVRLLTSTSTLYTINTSTGEPAVVGSTTVAPTIIDIAINSNGVMYAADLDDNLYTIDTGTGAATLIGPLGIDIDNAQGLDFDYATGILYLAGYTNITEGVLFTINTETGAATYIGSFPGGAEVDCLSIASIPGTPTPPPIPATQPIGLGLLILILSGVLSLASRKQNK